MKKDNFVHLHVHSEYSLLDGASRIIKLIEKASQYDMPALALTDHGVMYGAIEFYTQAKKSGIKPIIGCEVYLAPRSRREKKRGGEKKEEGFYYKPRVDKELLRKFHEGIIALSGCISGEIPKYIIADQTESAKRNLEEYIDIFGKNNFFFGITGLG